MDHNRWVIVHTRGLFAEATVAYGVTFSSSLLLWGRVSDIYGPKRVFVNA